MCYKFLNYISNFKISSFLKKIILVNNIKSTLIITFFIAISIYFAKYIYYSGGIIKLIIFFIAIIFLINAIFRGIYIVNEGRADWKNNKYYTFYICMQFIGVILGLIYFIFKFLNLLFILT